MVDTPFFIFTFSFGKADLIFCCVSGNPTVYFSTGPVGREKKIIGKKS